MSGKMDWDRVAREDRVKRHGSGSVYSERDEGVVRDHESGK